MRVPAEAHRGGSKPAVEGGEIEEHEGLDELAEVGRTHQAGDGPVGVSSRAVDDFPDWLLKLTCQHDSFLQLSWCCLFPGGSAELPEQIDEHGALGLREPARC